MNKFKITRDWLRLLTGISALGFGIYCFIIGIGAVAFEWVEFSFLLLILCIIFETIYILFGIFTRLTKPGGMSSFMAIGFFMGTYWWSSGLEWFMWPMIFMPAVILILTIVIILRFFLGNRELE